MMYLMKKMTKTKKAFLMFFILAEFCDCFNTFSELIDNKMVVIILSLLGAAGWYGFMRWIFGNGKFFG